MGGKGINVRYWNSGGMEIELNCQNLINFHILLILIGFSFHCRFTFQYGVIHAIDGAAGAAMQKIGQYHRPSIA